MKWIKVTERLPDTKIINNFFVKQRWKDSDEPWFPGTCVYSGEWEISDTYEVLEWLDETADEYTELKQSHQPLYTAREQVWLDAWHLLAKEFNCNNPDIAKKWADAALKAFDEQFTVIPTPEGSGEPDY